MSDLVKLYNPTNAASLTPEQVAGLQKLTSPEIKELATAYPNNMTMQRAYLMIIDNRIAPEKQLAKPSTFENLWNLRERNGMKHFVAFAFKGAYKARSITPLRPARSEVLDLSDTELMNLPGFKAANKIQPSQEVKVTKIKALVVPGEGGVSEVVNVPVKNFIDHSKKTVKKAATKKTKSK